MDILNFISWIKGSRVVKTVDPAKTLLPVGLKDPKRDDGYLSGAISVEDFTALFSTKSPNTVSIDFGINYMPKFMSVYNMEWGQVVPNTLYPYTYSLDEKVFYFENDNSNISIELRGDLLIQATQQIGTNPIQDITISGENIPQVTIINFTDINYTQAAFTIEGNNLRTLYIDSVNVPITLSLPKNIWSLYVNNTSNTTSLDFAQLENAGTIFITQNANLQSINFSNLIYQGRSVAWDASTWTIVDCPNLTTIITPSNLRAASERGEFQVNSLSQSTVDAILKMYVDLDGTNGKQLWGYSGSFSLDLSNGTNSAPSALGLTYVTTLVNRGATVFHN